MYMIILSAEVKHNSGHHVIYRILDNRCLLHHVPKIFINMGDL